MSVLLLRKERVVSLNKGYYIWILPEDLNNKTTNQTNPPQKHPQ
jgi:hypothetical protein